MKGLIFLILFFQAFVLDCGAQVNQKFTEAFNKFKSDKQFTYSSMGLTVVDSKTGKSVFDYNSNVGLTPASTLKIITSASSYELLGKDFTYKTQINLSKENNLVKVQIKGSGDPSLGSLRWKTTNKDAVFKIILNALKQNNVTSINELFIDDTLFTYQTIPNGWTYEDIGNYFGAGAWGLNWGENTFDLKMNVSGEKGSEAKLISSNPDYIKPLIKNYITIGEKGTGDNSLIFSTPYQSSIFMNGTLAAGNSPYTISGSLPDPGYAFGQELKEYLKKENIEVSKIKTYLSLLRENENLPSDSSINIAILVSPTYDSMDYWFMHKSLNIYGESFIKSIAINQGKQGSTKNGVEAVKNFWEKNGIDKAAIKIVDGSGLSPANRLTTNSLVNILEFARKKIWFQSFYNSLPEMNGLKMKSGYIGGVRSYAGYIKSKTGNEYSFAFIVNNFDGSPAAVREKMWKLLDLLK